MTGEQKSSDDVCKIDTKKIKVNKDYVLLVEGDDECYLLGKMLSDCGEKVQIINVKGKDNFDNVMESLSDKLIECKMVGIVRDAENDGVDYFEQTKALFVKYELSLPDKPGLFGSSNNNGARVGVYLMPDNQSKGMLEDLFLGGVADSEVFECVEEFMQCLGARGIEPSNMAKAKCLAFLAGQKKQGISRKEFAQLWNLEHPVMEPLKAFLEEFLAGP